MEIPYDVLAALNALQAQNYIPYGDVVLHSNARSAESTLIAKDGFEKSLSEDAQQVVLFILNTSEDVLATKSRKRELTWAKIKRYLIKNQLIKRQKAVKVEKEIVQRLLGND